MLYLWQQKRKVVNAVYEYQSKKINNYFELKDIIRKATSYFVGSFTLEMLMRREEWENPETKTAFIESLHQEYFAWDERNTLAQTRNKVNCVKATLDALTQLRSKEEIAALRGKTVEEIL